MDTVELVDIQKATGLEADNRKSLLKTKITNQYTQFANSIASINNGKFTNSLP